MLKSLILPAVTLGTGIMATIMRMTRSSVLETMRQDYVSTARAKGISESQVTTRHMLKNALIPIITSAGLQFGHLLGGSMLTETVFSWPGVGRYMLDAIKTKDTPAVLGSVILMSVSFSVVNLLVDILYAFVDPRIKSQYKKPGNRSFFGNPTADELIEKGRSLSDPEARKEVYSELNLVIHENCTQLFVCHPLSVEACTKYVEDFVSNKDGYNRLWTVKCLQS